MNTNNNRDWSKNPIVPLKQPFRGARGVIQSLVSLSKPEIQSAVLIESKKGSVRANYYHKTDWHYCYVISGSIEYYSHPVGSNQDPKKTIIQNGQVFYTPAMVEHAMVFPEDTAFLTLGGNTRLPEDYEADLIRVKLV